MICSASGMMLLLAEQKLFQHKLAQKNLAKRSKTALLAVILKSTWEKMLAPILPSLLSSIVMKAQSKWLLANEHRIESTCRTINYIKGVKMMRLRDKSFKSVHELRKDEVEASKYD